MDRLLDVGQALTCEHCSFEVVVSAPCNCKDGSPTMECCGSAMITTDISEDTSDRNDTE